MHSASTTPQEPVNYHDRLAAGQRGIHDAALLAVRGKLRPDLQAKIDRLATEDPVLTARYSALVRLALLVQRARGGDAASISVGLLTGLLIAREDPEYAAALLAEQRSDTSSESVRASIRELMDLAPIREVTQ